MPDFGRLGYLLDSLNSLGYAKNVGGDLAPQDWTDIYSWVQLFGIKLNDSELNIIKRLSVEYVNNYYRFNGQNVPSPHQKSDEDVENKFKRLFAMLKGSS